MDRESASAVLATPLAQELLRSSPLAHLAYIGRDGYPRVIPTGYVWKGGSSWCALRTTRRKCGASDLIPGSPSDRKSTRLNSSHVAISYAVFCLKKKNNNIH